jgi:hypothetical protein
MNDTITWSLIVGGPQAEPPSAERNRRNLRALRESRRGHHASLIDRLRGVTSPKPAEIDFVCCTA